MAIKIVQVFKTEDNVIFDSRDAAQTHEATVETMKALSAVLFASIKSGSPESMLKEILLESQAVSNVLTRYRKRMPKAVKEKEPVSV